MSRPIMSDCALTLILDRYNDGDQIRSSDIVEHFIVFHFIIFIN